ncbi:restriction endonuclease subunit S [Streptomyces sp. NPDC017958]|uniref:restriction endonuclease subunit S n=1 Tax=Streptomyces sp. NPDC017958 TaxID=3365021 RepID=UPI0037AE2AD4
MSVDGERGLPAGWAWADLGEIAYSALGKMLDKKQSSGLHPTPYLRNVNVQWGRIDTGDLLTMDIEPGELGRFLVSKGDLVVCEGGEIGRCAIWNSDEPIAYQKALHRVRPTQALDTRYLRYYLEYAAASGKLSRFATGSTIKHLPQQRLREVPVPLAPLAEQHRIVEALEEHLSRLDTAASSLDAGQRRAQGLRSAALTGALERIGGVPTKRLGDLLKEPLRNGHSAKATTDPGGIRTLNLTAVTQGEFSDANTKLTVADPQRVQGLWLTRGDILVQRSNTPELVGTAALYEGPDDWAIFPDLLIRVRVNEDVLSEYVTLNLQSRHGRSYFKSQAKGLAGSMPKIDQSTIENFTFSVPPLDVQARVVAEVRDEMDRVARVSSELERARRRSVGLRNALLRTAFNGKLVPQDSGDETAHVALARIAGERAAQPKAKRPRKATPRRSAKPPAPRAAEATGPAPEPTPAPALAVQQEFDL